MTAKKLIQELRRCNPNLEVEMFAHDQATTELDEGVGPISTVFEETDVEGRVFIVLHA